MMPARLTVERGDASPCEWTLESGRVIRLGRNKTNDIVLIDERASRFHAEIYREGDRWYLRDTGTTNGTRLNNRRIHGATVLDHGCTIGVGDVLIRFIGEQSERPTDELPALVTPPPRTEAAEVQPDVEVGSTILEPDELTKLLKFMDDSLRETSAAGVVTLALRTIHKAAHAAVAGYLSLDGDVPLAKMTHPALSKVDIHLSRTLTEQVQETGRTAWLSNINGSGIEPVDSLVSYHDAVCVPVQTGDSPLGALHVYRVGSSFSPREVRFCEAMAGYLSRCLHVLRSRAALEADNSRLRERAAITDKDLIGDSPPMQRLKGQIGKLADGPKIILICGESGSGKELVALALHRQSRRHEGPLVPVNCAAISSGISEAELFGHARGSFTGADRDRPGYFHQADMGTLFLDEIGELSEECQAKLLRVLETGRFCPVGSAREEAADVRIIAATNRDLKRQFQEGKFRKDLYYRLGIEIKVPALRERLEDIPALAEHFLARLSVEYRRPFRLSASALQRLSEYHWPGNVRQLRAVLERAAAMSESNSIGHDELHLTQDSPAALLDGPSLNLEELERWAIRQAIARTEGNVSQAAKMLGIHRETLMLKMKKYEIDRKGV